MQIVRPPTSLPVRTSLEYRLFDGPIASFDYSICSWIITICFTWNFCSSSRNTIFFYFWKRLTLQSLRDDETSNHLHALAKRCRQIHDLQVRRRPSSRSSATTPIESRRSTSPSSPSLTQPALLKFYPNGFDSNGSIERFLQ